MGDGEVMDQKRTNCKETVLMVLLFPVILLCLVGLLLITTFDYFKYKRTQYYKDTHEKYSWLCTSSYYIKLYNLIKKEQLPIMYYPCNNVLLTGYGYFVYRDILLLNDCEPYFDEEKKTWTFYEGESDEYVDIEEECEIAIERCNDFLGREVCKKALVLIDDEVYQEHPGIQYEKFDFLPVEDGNEAKALKKMIAER